MTQVHLRAIIIDEFFCQGLNQFVKVLFFVWLFEPLNEPLYFINVLYYKSPD